MIDKPSALANSSAIKAVKQFVGNTLIIAVLRTSSKFVIFLNHGYNV